MTTSAAFSLLRARTADGSTPQSALLSDKDSYDILNPIPQQFLKRRDSVSSVSDTASEASGDSRSSYETSGTSVSVFQDSLDSRQWPDSNYHQQQQQLPNRHHDWAAAGQDRSFASVVQSYRPQYESDEIGDYQSSTKTSYNHRIVPTADHDSSTQRCRHPRRTAIRTIPCLVRQEDRRRDLVEQLVGKSHYGKDFHEASD